MLLKLLEDQRTFPDQGQERAWVIRLLMATAGAAVLASPTLRIGIRRQCWLRPEQRHHWQGA